MFFFGLVARLGILGVLDSHIWGNKVIPFVFSYQKHGFASRIFIGSIIDIFCDYITRKQIYILNIVMNLITFFAICLMLYIMLKRIKDKKAVGYFKFICLMYIFYPFATINGGYLFNFTDIYLLFFCVLAILIYITLNQKYWFISIIPLIMALLTHSVSMFLYIPAVFIILIIRSYILNKKFSHVVKNFLIVFIPVLISFFIVFFVKKLTYDNPEDMIKAVENYTDLSPLDISESFLKYEYFSNLHDNFLHYNFQGKWHMVTDPVRVVHLIIQIVIWIIINKVWFNCYKKSNKNYKKIFILIMFLPLVIIPLMIGSDAKRWYDGIICMEFLIMFYLLSENDASLIKTLYDIKKWFDSHHISCVIILFVLLIFNYNSSIEEAYAFNGLIFHIVKRVQRVLK